jgi:hypothetical protein
LLSDGLQRSLQELLINRGLFFRQFFVFVRE